MFMHKKSWVESVKELLGIRHRETYINTKRNSDNHYESKEFILPEKNNSYKHMVAYLTQTRKIDSSMINDLIKENKLYEDIHRNCVFVGTDIEGNPQYANLRSTNTNINSFKGDAKNSNKAFPFAIQGKDEIVYVFESPIEVLSYMTIKKQFDKELFEHHAISLGGVGDKALENYLVMYPEIKKIVLCLNNDQAGFDGTERNRTKYKEYEINENYPSHKDYNEDLKRLVRAKEIKERSNNANAILLGGNMNHDFEESEITYLSQQFVNVLVPIGIKVLDYINYDKTNNSFQSAKMNDYLAYAPSDSFEVENLVLNKASMSAEDEWELEL